MDSLTEALSDALRLAESNEVSTVDNETVVDVAAG